MTKGARWAWIVSLVAATGAALVLGFMLSVATNDQVRFERHYVWLFWVNVAVASLLALVIVIAAVRLTLRVRRGKFGSRLLARMAMTFALVGVLPGLLIYTVSYQFVTRSIENWFDARVEGALDAGLSLGRSTLDALVNDVGARTRLAAERLGDTNTAVQPLALERLREELRAVEVAVVGPSGQVLVSAGGRGAIAVERPTPAMLREARAGRATSRLEGLDDESTPGARVRALVPIPNNTISLGGEDHYLLVTQAVPNELATNALAVQTAYREYQQRALARDGLRKMYIGTLTLVLILAVFGAVLLAIVFGNRLARPLLLLAEGVRQVAGGDLRRKPVFASNDELGGLTRSFAAMTDQLSDARETADRSRAQLERARTRLQTVLDNLSAGVIVFARDGSIELVNPGATRILKLPLSAHVGGRLEDVPGLQGFAQAVRERFELQRTSPEAGERDEWQDAYELQPQPPVPGAAAAAERDTLTLILRGAALPQDARLLVFDDITEVVSAQRSAAWSEVARRLAHEIKNPLTPIQLSAERLQHKLEAKLEGADQAMLVRSVATIVNQVQAMKQLVNEFRDYARLPAAHLTPLDLNALVSDVLGLYVDEQERRRLVAACAEPLPLVQGDATQLRQVVHNLVQNALDSIAGRTDGQVRVTTEVARNDEGQVRAVRLSVSDNGPGFAEKVLKRAFEPYVTTKSKGTGLGLAVVKKIADEHGVRVRIANLTEGEGGPAVSGARVSLSFSLLPAPAPARADRPDTPAGAPAVLHDTAH